MTGRALLAAALLAVVAWAEVQPLLDPQMFERNLQRWRGMDAAEREALHTRWVQFQRLPEARRAELRQRLGALQRMNRQHRRRHGVAPDAEDVRGELSQVEARARHVLGPLPVTRPDAPPGIEERSEVRRRLEQKTGLRMRGFLDGLEREGRLEVGERANILTLPFRERINECLELQKREQLALYVDVGGQADVRELEALEPIEAIETVRRVRRERGFLGAAGKLMELTPVEQRELQRALDAGDLERAKRLMAPKARAMLEREQVALDVVESTLNMPFSQLERRLHRLLRHRIEADAGAGSPTGASGPRRRVPQPAAGDR